MILLITNQLLHFTTVFRSKVFVRSGGGARYHTRPCVSSGYPLPPTPATQTVKNQSRNQAQGTPQGHPPKRAQITPKIAPNVDRIR